MHSTLIYYFGNKIYNYDKRSWMSLSFFSGTLFITLFSFKSNLNTLKTIIEKIYLNKNGKSIFYKSAIQLSRYNELCITKI